MEDVIEHVNLKPEPSYRNSSASDKALMTADNPFTPHYDLSLLPEHRQPMQIPSNSVLPGESSSTEVPNDKSDVAEDAIDSESVKGIFGWATVDGTCIPTILRRQKKFVSVRIVERKLLSKYPNTFPDELGKKDPLVSYFITAAEAKLLNEINVTHCDYEYGHNPFTVKDLIVDLEEFEEFFKIVKKTFPAEVLAKIGGELSLSAAAPLGKTDLSQCCGWMQINNTVSPYILRTENGKQVKLVPLSVIVYAAGLLTNSSVDGLLPTPQECSFLNEACKTAGFEFEFGKNTRLISINEVLQRCQVQLFELPFKNPLQHARYLDSRTGQPSSSPLVTPISQANSTASLHTHQPPRPVRASPSQPANMELIPVSQPDINPFLSMFQSPSLRPQMLGLSGNYNALQQHYAGIDPARLPLQRSQLIADNAVDNSGAAISHSIPGLSWPGMPRLPPPAHSNTSSMMVKTPPVTPDPPISVAYPLSSLPQQPKISPSMPDLSHPIYQRSHAPQRPSVSQLLQKDNSAHMVRYPPPVTGLPPSPHQYAQSSAFPFGVNQFDSSLFARTEIPDPRYLRDSTGANSAGSRRRSLESPQNSALHMPHFAQLMHATPASYSSNNNYQKAELSRMISACLVNGKSISCLNVNFSHRKGNFCLVEAVSKLYFPTVPLAEFVKVLQTILKVNLYECTAEEEAAFVQYYNLPVNKLKCNKIIRVDDLENYFPQLNYMFTKCSTEQASKSDALAGHKRRASSPLTGQPSKMQHPKSEGVSGMHHGTGAGVASNGGTRYQALDAAPVIVIDE
ncbi:uncharacterized protein LOC106054299 isoform X1 [Biomphalaria glabrata]|uniref:Uncharacterized protein LOC106054299 isoform X1 n=1 Tax=Biomphalaria glabrata TaxID=6526 RepID=A0A9U8DYA7_BIOGL|nr:uncharacterized protein LOC106054299 isoform X1 [Biomphalaria glabrata]